MALVIAIIVSSMLPVAYASSKHKTKVKTIYSIVIKRDSCEMYVFARKSNSTKWKLVGKDICSVGNPFWPTPSGTFKVWKRQKRYESDGEKFSYATYFGCHRMVICAAPKTKDDFYKLGNACTMGQVWLRSSKAKWIYKHIPNGTKVYVF